MDTQDGRPVVAVGSEMDGPEAEEAEEVVSSLDRFALGWTTELP